MKLGKIINSTAKIFLHVIFPVQCPVCENPAEIICDECLKNLFHDKNIIFRDTKNLKIYVASKYEDNIKKIIHELKYKNSKLLGYKLGCEIAKLFERPNANYLVPVPLHIDSTRKYNQAYEIARGLGHVWNIKIFNETAWTKIVQRRALLGVAERKLLSEDAFKITGDLNNLKISIVDDVCTTGTTLLKFAQACKNSGAFVESAYTIAGTQ